MSELGTLFGEQLLERLQSTITAGVLDALKIWKDGEARDAVTGQIRVAPTATPAPVANASGWVKVDMVSFKSGRVTRTIRKGSPVKVRGLGRGAGIGSGWMVVGLEQRGEETNVEVQKGKSNQPRFVKLDRIIYVIPRGIKELGQK